jgi:tRNA A37 N6-isopentenylltransferase MiaA
MTELEIQIEYAKRQFEWFKTLAHIRVAEGNFDAADQFARHMEECNDFISNSLRKLNDLE